MKRISQLLALAVIAALAASAAADSGRQAFLNNRVSLALDRTDITAVMRLLAKQNNFNVAIAGEVSGDVSMILNDVPLHEALDAILLPNNLSWYMKENMMVVKPAGYLASDERITTLVHLKYVSCEEAKLATSQLLSTGGRIEILVEGTDATANRATPSVLAVSDRGDIVEEVVRVISELDRPQPLLNISVKLVETNLSLENKIGVDWPESYPLIFGGLPDAEGNPGLPLASHPLDGGRWTWGTFAASSVSAALDLMIKSGHSKLLSDPNLTTVSNHPAEIAVTTTIPIQTLNRFTEGAVIQDIVSFQDLDVGITLRVKGHVTDSNYVSLDVNPVIEEITGYTGPVDNQRPITSKRSVTTSVRVKNGETLVIGGLIKDAKFDTIKKFPLLGSIPGIGKIFQHNSAQTTKTDLSILITPTIVTE
jgi:type IV pilus assembly protein PilQ